jgi:hypothetical protein
MNSAARNAKARKTRRGTARGKFVCIKRVYHRTVNAVSKGLEIYGIP